jgi:hypothetical protein
MKLAGVKILSIIICIVATALVLSQYAKLIQHILSIQYSWRFELYMVLGMLAFQYPFMYKKSCYTKLDYYYKMLLVSLMGSLLLLPLLLLNHYILLSDAINVSFFFLIVGIMFFVHKYIVTKMQLPFYLSYTYILYRFIIALFII